MYINKSKLFSFTLAFTIPFLGEQVNAAAEPFQVNSPEWQANLDQFNSHDNTGKLLDAIDNLLKSSTYDPSVLDVKEKNGINIKGFGPILKEDKRAASYVMIEYLFKSGPNKTQLIKIDKNLETNQFNLSPEFVTKPDDAFILAPELYDVLYKALVSTFFPGNESAIDGGIFITTVEGSDKDSNPKAQEWNVCSKGKCEKYKVKIEPDGKGSFRYDIRK